MRGNYFSSVPCPHCGNVTTETTSSSTMKPEGEYRRIRTCPKCKKTFSTYEVYAHDAKFLRVARKAFTGRGAATEDSHDEPQV
jgi:transcriptional regulator NrdR family protein